MKLIRVDKLEADMYHNAFEIDTDLQKWDSGCWIRYKMFENVIERQPIVEAIPTAWIEKWLDKTTGTRVGEDISQLPEQLKFAIEMINLMEMDWEKENETEIE